MVTEYGTGVKILGYSERGIVSSLLYEMNARKDSLALFGAFLDLYKPMCKNERPEFGDLRNVTALLEHSFSDFGDADIILNVNTCGGASHCIFVEAKVSNAQ